MPNTLPNISAISYLDPGEIVVNREGRQRTDVIDTADLEESILRLGVLHPIIVRQSDMSLISGERRLRACIALDIKVPVRYIETLTPVESKIIELEENVKRKDLPWQDRVTAIAEIHNLNLKNARQNDKTWSVAQTARHIGIEDEDARRSIAIHHFLNDSRLKEAQSASHAYSILIRIRERQAAEAIDGLMHEMNDILELGAEPETKSNAGTIIKDATKTKEEKEEKEKEEEQSWQRPISVLNFSHPDHEQPVISADFIEWAATYRGPKFNLLHVDFPYGVGLKDTYTFTESEPYENNPEIYFRLLRSLCGNLSRIMSHSANMVFWFSMNHYDETVKMLRASGLHVRNHPLVWMKSDNRGTSPNRGTEPCRNYDTALLCTRGQRSLVKQISNAFHGPSPGRPIHPSQKSEVMLKYFFSGLIDDTTTLLDPTCGSGCALVAAEDLGVKVVLGLELNPEYANAANSYVRKARLLRKVSMRPRATVQPIVQSKV